jgi:hypothetical protein
MWEPGKGLDRDPPGRPRAIPFDPGHIHAMEQQFDLIAGYPTPMDAELDR